MPSSLFFVYKQPLDGSMSPLFRGGKMLPIGNSSRCAVRNLVSDADSCARCVGVLRRDKTRLYLMTQVGSIIQHTLPPPSPSSTMNMYCPCSPCKTRIGRIQYEYQKQNESQGRQRNIFLNTLQPIQPGARVDTPVRGAKINFSRRESPPAIACLVGVTPNHF